MKLKPQKKPRKTLTIKQRKFVDAVVESWNASDAVVKAGYNVKNKGDWIARALWSENLSKPNIQAEIEDRLRNAKNMIYTIAMTWEKEDTRLRASQDIIDRNEGKPTQKIEQKLTADVNVWISEEQRLALLERFKIDNNL